MEGIDPVKLAEGLAGPTGAIVALLFFVVYLLREVSAAHSKADHYMTRYEDMRAQRDEYRYLASDALRAGKRAAQTAVALGADDDGHEVRSHHRRGSGRHESDGDPQ